MCRVLRIHRSGFYDWLKEPLSERSKEDQRLLGTIRASYLASGGIYGSPRIHRDLLEAGEWCGENRVARIGFSSLKKERIRRSIYRTRDEARSGVFDYMEVFYIRSRRLGGATGAGGEKMKRMIKVILVAAIVSVSATVMVADGAGAATTSDSVAAITVYLDGSSNSQYRQVLKDCLAGPQNQWRDRFNLTAKSDDPELLAMVICSNLLEMPEKQYWIDILPSMLQQQKDQLKGSLAAELQRGIDPLHQELETINRQLQNPDEQKQ